MSDADRPIRETEVPASPDIATGHLLGAGDVDRLAAALHALMEEVADVSVRLARVEARLDGREDEAPDDLASVQAHVGALVGRVLG